MPHLLDMLNLNNSALTLENVGKERWRQVTVVVCLESQPLELEADGSEVQDLGKVRPCLKKESRTKSILGGRDGPSGKVLV